MKIKEFKEFGLIIIESLEEDEKKTGQILHNEVIRYKKFREPNLSSIYYSVNTREQFFQILDDLIKTVNLEKFFPILHLESHGFEDGIQLSSDENILWSELMPVLREINILLENRLVVNLGMCSGGSIIAHIDPSDRAPFRAVIGTFKRIDEGRLLNAFEVFYDNFFFSFDPIESLQIMNNVINENKPIFHILTCEHCFDGILDTEIEPDNFKETVNTFSIQEKMNNPAFKNTPFVEVRKYTEELLRGVLEEGKKNKDYFLMKDLREK